MDIIDREPIGSIGKFAIKDGLDRGWWSASNGVAEDVCGLRSHHGSRSSLLDFA
ncbi:hypothetical protein PC116_g21706 [Phytophthora cactorum]|nr:hypothetical protein PC116_g21706 [Phytophthora cactorum]